MSKRKTGKGIEVGDRVQLVDPLGGGFAGKATVIAVRDGGRTVVVQTGHEWRSRRVDCDYVVPTR
jgi:hypothetical protein